MQPVIALVGRPNVGKSTLFNRLTRSRDALVADLPGLTRDRQYGLGRLGDRPYVVIDTGGLTGEQDVLDEAMARQTRLAIDEADAVLLMVDGRGGMTAADQQIAERLRTAGKTVSLVVNKTDGVDVHSACAEFYRLGLGDPVPIAASHGRGVRQLIMALLATFPAAADESEEPGGDAATRVAIVGRPNVGKSTLINRLIGEERLVAYDLPGTTRDSIEVPFERAGQRYTLIDTAGLRRRGRVHEVVEKFSVVKTLQAIERCHVVVLLLDAQQGIADQDASLLGLVLDSGRSIVVAVNKWDGLERGAREEIQRKFDFRLGFLDFADIHFISAKHGSGVGKLFGSIDAAYRSSTVDCKASELTRILEDAVQRHPPPRGPRHRIKMRYAHQGGRNPLRVIIHGNQVDSVPDSYRRYLSNTFRKALKLTGAAVRIEFKVGTNPYEGKKNPLTTRQQAARRRLIKHVKR